MLGAGNNQIERVSAKCEELLAKLEEHYARHCEEYLAACEEYRKTALLALEARAKALQGKSDAPVDLRFEIDPPDDHRLDYERAIGLLTLHKNAGEETIKITPELYAKLDKPYNYRNVLGAAISYGPILPKELVASVLNYAFITPGVLSTAFQLGELQNASLELRSKTKGVTKMYALPIGGTK